jgi:deoxyribonuclease II
MTLSAMDDSAEPVDWWFMYKVAGKSSTTEGARAPQIGGHTVTGGEYLYFDANGSTGTKLALSPNEVGGSGALGNTLQQVYGPSDSNVGWFFYNDENPIDGKVNGARGHTKGVLAFDMGSDTAFWLIQSTPKFPPRDAYSFPTTGMENAQTLLCVTLQDASVAQSIAKQMFVAQQPNVYHASDVPSALTGEPNDPRVKLMNDQVAAGSTPVHVVIPFQSKAGLKFMSIAKNKTWNLDFYNDLVGPTLAENLDVETWEHDPVPPPDDSDKVHTVVDMKAVNLDALGLDVMWPEADDHAKLCISAASESTHYVCVGDINFTIAQRKRGGGTVAFQCEPLWSSISSILEGVAPFPDTTPGTPHAATRARANRSPMPADATARATTATTKGRKP